MYIKKDCSKGEDDCSHVNIVETVANDSQI